MNIASQLFGPSPNGKQTAQTNMINDAIAKQLDIIESKIDRLAEDMALLLDDRTAPLEFDAVQIQAKKISTAETKQIHLEDEESEDEIMQTQRLRRSAIERFERKVLNSLGGPVTFKKKLHAKLARIRIEGSTATTGKGYGIGKLRIHDDMKVHKDGICSPGTCSVDFFTIEEREQLKQYIRDNYSYIIRGRHA